MLLICAYMVGGKFMDDLPLLSSEYLKLLSPGREQHVTKSVLCAMEIAFLESISWNLLVSRDAYTRTYFQLLNITDPQPQCHSEQRPITPSEGAKLGLGHDVGELRYAPLLTHTQRENAGRKLWPTMTDMRLLKCERSLCDAAVQLGPKPQATAVIS